VLYALNVNTSHEAARKAAARTAAAATTASAAPATSPPASVRPAPPASGATSGAGSGAAEGKSTYAGETDGGAAGLAIAGNNGKAVAYVCDGKAAEAWMSGAMDGGKIQLRSAKGTSTLFGTYADGYAQGTVVAGKRSWTFKIKLARKPSGLYRSAAGVRGRLDASWAVTPDGKQFGVQRIGTTLVPAPPLDTTTGTAMAGGTPVAVETVADPANHNW
jgi:hypothetical protein